MAKLALCGGLEVVRRGCGARRMRRRMRRRLRRCGVGSGDGSDLLILCHLRIRFHEKCTCIVCTQESAQHFLTELAKKQNIHLEMTSIFSLNICNLNQAYQNYKQPPQRFQISYFPCHFLVLKISGIFQNVFL